ncbi:MAG: hypothetical protein NC078_06290 [Ruminococcus sp.]|nr:hypothetical protein [Ruminococcus sp.]
MINKDEAKVDAWSAIADIVGIEYFRTHFEGSCHSYPAENQDDVEYEYFIGFDDINDTDENWKVFARVSVNRETEKVTILDYKTPDGKRMDNPPKPVRFA